MASRDEAKFRVRLDSRQAKGDLRGLTREAARTAGRVGQGLRGAVSRGLGAVGLGAGIGTGLAAVKGATESGFGDAIGEAFAGFGAQLNDLFLGDVDDKARAAKSAREDTIQAFGALAGRSGSIPPGAKNYFNQVQKLRLEEEKGRSLFQQNEAFQGPGIKDLVDRIMEGFGKLLKEAVSALADKLNPFK